MPRILLLLLVASYFAAAHLCAQERKVDPTWLQRYVPNLGASDAAGSATCHYTPIFGAGDADNRILRSVARFGEATIDAGGNCPSVAYDREEEIYFVLAGKGTLHYEDRTYAMRANDFTYLPPGVRHSMANSSDQPARVLVMGFKIPAKKSLSAPPDKPKIVNLDDVKEETVDGHPNSVLYKLLAGPSTATRDAIDEAYVVTSLFWMDFAPGGTNFPHHHESAEEIYLVIDGQGEMVAGSGVDGIAGKYPAKTGDAYYFRSNCTVGFYNQDKPGAKAHILAVRSRVAMEEPD
jgi:mannose-6-phosphate isomerase-like protein (cupin superfamily)